MPRATRHLIIFLVALACLAGAAGQALGATISLTRTPGPPQAVLNDGASTLSYAYTIDYASAPDHYDLSVIDPDGAVVQSQTFGISGVASPYSSSGTYTVPAAAKTGTWRLRVSYFADDPGLDYVFEQSAEVTFNVANAVGTLRLVKFEDRNGNGVRDVGEPGVPNWPMTVTGPSGPSPVVRSFATGADGTLTIPNLLVGQYEVAEASAPSPATPGETWVNTDGATTKTLTVANASSIDAVFANARLGEICGTTWRDANRDGIRDAGEAAEPSVALTLSGVAGASTTSNASGRYCFTSLAPGNYRIVSGTPSGLVATGDADGAGNGLTQIDTSLASGEAKDGQDFGFAPPPPPAPRGSICGVVYHDDNANGARDPQEKRRVAGAVVVLSGAASSRAVTGADGAYCFTNLLAGSYRVADTPPSPLEPSGDADGPANGISLIAVALPIGGQVTGRDFGVKPPPATLSITKRASAKVRRGGDLLTWTITVRNTSKAQTARAVVVSDPLPLRASVVSLGGGHLRAGLVVWSLGDLAPGAKKTVRFVVRIDRTLDGGRIANTASAEAVNSRKVSSTATVRIIARPPTPRRVAVTG